MKFKEIDKIAGTFKVPAIWVFKKREWKFIILFFLLINFQNTFSQNISSNIRGIIKDAISQEELVGATLQLIDNENINGIITDENGEFLFENVVVGRYEMKVSYIGYETKKITEIFVESGKETVLEIQLSESENELNEVVVKANSNENVSQNYLSHHVITVEETERFPATFYDPARLAAAYPGVVNTNDQANNISIRGNSPANMKWYLEGVEIVNPNHLTTAGMFGDQISLGGGGVNILSAQMLNTSTILKGAYPANYGNAVGGIMDMRLRGGNNKNYEFTGQAGLLGFDIAAEGPFSKKSDASFLVNYRYSFTGLLDRFGVDLRDEKINYQDISATLNFPTNKFGAFKLFGVLGDSRTTYFGNTPSKEERERYILDYQSKTWLTGITHKLSINKKSSWENIVVVSGADIMGINELINRIPPEVYKTKNKEVKLSGNTNFQFKFNSKNKVTLGLNYRWMNYDIDYLALTKFGISMNIAKGTANTNLFQPFINYNVVLNSKVISEIGLRYSYFNFNNSQSFEPRLSIKYLLQKNQNFVISTGIYSQVQNDFTYNEGGEFFQFFIERNRQLDFTKSFYSNIGYVKRTDKMLIQAEIYFQKIFDVPVFETETEDFSILNVAGIERDNVRTLSNKGNGRNYGVEIGVQQSLFCNYFFHINSTLYRSEYKSISDKWRNSRWNGNYAFNLIIGKEFERVKKNKVRFFGINLHLNYSGGMRTEGVNQALSESRRITIFNDDKGLSEKLPDYFRSNMRTYLKWNKNKFNSMLSIDIQNVTNNRNAAYYYYDSTKDEILLKEQLGMIPVLNYRIEF